MKIFRITLFISLVAFLSNPVHSYDPPQPPITHEEEEDRIPGGGAPLNNHWSFWAISAGMYLFGKFIQNKAKDSSKDETYNFNHPESR